MLNIEKYRDGLEKNDASLDYDIFKIRIKKEEVKKGKAIRDLCCLKTCSECRKENIEWLLSEYKEPILDEVEKRYLRGVIRPFRDKVKSITKFADTRCTEEYIYMVVEGPADACLPRFDGNTMYKGMELGKEYTLEELGL